jgi:sugar-specific transcriptional regulator TrmB
MVPPKKTPRLFQPTAKDREIQDALSAIGLTDFETRVYLGILRHPMSRIPEISRWSGVPQPKVYATVKRLIERGLCQTHLGPVNTYSATPPESSFVPLLAEMKERHEAARNVVRTLNVEHSESDDPLAARDGRIKLFQGRQATARNFVYLMSTAEKEIEVVARLPLIVQDDDDELEKALARGVRVRFLLDLPDDFDLAAEPVFERQHALGAEARRRNKLPMRMAVFDRRYALLPIHDPARGREGSMVLEVRNESLAGGLREIFEMLWETAKPVSLGAQKKRKTARRKG